ncbi:MAG: hypothetical protein CSA04_02490 [Bacteroidetes bacterium]|nr:MAG: hypothetical protein CSA04_02490 [Bacteroidota bacterium]
MWRYPWRYAEGFAICIGLFVTGAVLQYLLGPLVLTNFRYPVNLIFALFYLLALGGLSGISKRNKYVFWFTQQEAAITSMASLLVLVIIMGFTRQIPSLHLLASPHDSSMFDHLGFHQMTRSYSFVLLYLYFLSILGITTLRRLSQFTWNDVTFVMNHLGLFVALLAGMLGTSDRQRLRMQTKLAQVEWRATNEEDQLVELPLAIELQSFTIEQYPPKLLIISNETGEALPVSQPHSLLVEQVPVSGDFLTWQVEVTTFLPMAAAVVTGDTIRYVNFETHGATSALYVKASKGNVIKEGWVSAGNHMFPHCALTLDSLHSIVMPEREPKRYASEVKVYTKKSGRETRAVIEVNKPLKIEGWKIYQLSYDETMGRWSDISIFELVKDPWLPYVYIGIVFMLIGAIGLFIVAQKEEVRND